MMILHTEPNCYDAASLGLLEGLGTVHYCEASTQEQVLETLQQQPYEALFARLGMAVDRELMETAPALKYIVTPTTGLDHIDLKAAEERGIQVVSLKGETEFLNTIHSTAEHTWSLLLALIRRLPASVESVKAGNWSRAPFMASELGGKTLGIIGYGRLGKIVAGYGVAFRMNVLVCDTAAIRPETLPSGVTLTSLAQLLAESDVVSLHIPSTPANRNFLNGERISEMKKGALLINTARGEVMEETALLEALESGQLAGAAIDVLDGDSTWETTVPAGHPLVAYAQKHNNLLITPHSGGYGQESIYATRAFITQKFLKLVQ